MVHISTMKMDVLLFIYGPNRDDPNFYTNLNENIAKLKIPNLILAGDWNLVLEPTIDYCNYKRTNNVKAQEKVEEIIADHCLERTQPATTTVYMETNEPLSTKQARFVLFCFLFQKTCVIL